MQKSWRNGVAGSHCSPNNNSIVGLATNARQHMIGATKKKDVFSALFAMLFTEEVFVWAREIDARSTG